MHLNQLARQGVIFQRPLSGGGGGGSAILSARTDADTGEVTFPSESHGFVEGDNVDITWDGGSLPGMFVGTVTGDTVVIDGGCGDSLPSVSTVVTVAVCTPYKQYCCGSPLSIASPDYVWDACPNPFTTYNDGTLDRIPTWPSRVGSLDLDEDGVREAPFFNEPGCTPNIITAGQIGSIECPQFINDYLVSADFPSPWSQPYTIGAVVKWKGLTGLGQYNVCDGNDTTNRATIFIKQFDEWLAMFAGTTLNGTHVPVLDGVDRIIAVFNGASSKLYVDGVEDASGDAGSNDLHGISLGQRATSLGTSAYFAGVIGEFALWNKALTPTEVGQVNTFWETKWTNADSRP